MTDLAFNLQAGPTDATEWAALARQAEADGFAALFAADHPGVTAAPFVALAAAASVTSRIELGTYVVNLGVRNPMHVAIDVATLDVVSGGRAVCGLGAGHTPLEWSSIGDRRPESPRARIDHFLAAADAVRALLRGDAHTGGGLVDARLQAPRPVRDPVPLLIGGGNTRLLRYAAQHADIVGMTSIGRTLADGHSHEVRWRRAEIEAHFALVHEAAAEAGRTPKIDVLVQRCVVTDDAAKEAHEVATELGGVTADDLLAGPYVLVGTAVELDRHRRELGVTGFTFRPPMLDAVAAIRAAGELPR